LEPNLFDADSVEIALGGTLISTYYGRIYCAHFPEFN